MGRGTRTLPSRLPEKLQQVRLTYKLNFQEMGEKLSELVENHGYADIKIFRGHIKEFEQGKREPQIPILLAYAKLANVYVDVLIDDSLTLPKHLPCKNKSSGFAAGKEQS